MGGTLRIIPASPKLGEIEGRLTTAIPAGENGGNNGMVQAVLNIPVGGDFLLFAVPAYQFDNSGYVDNVAALNARKSFLRSCCCNSCVITVRQVVMNIPVFVSAPSGNQWMSLICSGLQDRKSSRMDK